MATPEQLLSSNAHNKRYCARTLRVASVLLDASFAPATPAGNRTKTQPLHPQGSQLY